MQEDGCLLDCYTYCAENMQVQLWMWLGSGIPDRLAGIVKA